MGNDEIVEIDRYRVREYRTRMGLRGDIQDVITGRVLYRQLGAGRAQRIAVRLNEMWRDKVETENAKDGAGNASTIRDDSQGNV